jgi:hypothetical protein
MILKLYWMKMTNGCAASLALSFTYATALLTVRTRVSGATEPSRLAVPVRSWLTGGLCPSTQASLTSQRAPLKVELATFDYRLVREPQP